MAKTDEIEKAVVTLIGCTRRKKRAKSITDIAAMIEFLRDELGSYSAVANKVGLSTEMLREFRSVKQLDPEIHTLVEKRIIDSVDLVYRISKLDSKSQKALVEKFLKGDLTLDDARVLKSFKGAKGVSATYAISKVVRSRDIRTYILRFPVPRGRSKKLLREEFRKITGEQEIVAFKIEGQRAVLELSYKGQKKLRDAARRDKLTLARSVQNIIGGE
ncbi:MAG TPA: hypothetical protein VMW16_10175 [Sedimentisphaerales bacterium]|nr:hypothetical protein [Sedimentisphaerales bacterium]